MAAKNKTKRAAGVQYGEKKGSGVEDVFIAELAKGASPTAAAVVAGIGRRTAFDWRRDDEVFAQRWAEAVDQGVDLLEDEARRRAAEGCLRPVFQGGELVGHIREFSDTLMVLMLKGRRPATYNTERHEHSGKDGKPIAHKVEVEFVKAKDGRPA